MMNRAVAAVLALGVIALAPRAAEARVVRVAIDSRTLIGAGKTFGAAGAYERIVGRIYFAFDPRNAYDRQIARSSISTVRRAMRRARWKPGASS